MNFKVRIISNIRKSVRGKVVVVFEIGDICSATYGDHPGETYIFSEKYGKHFKVGINTYVTL